LALQPGCGRRHLGIQLWAPIGLQDGCVDPTGRKVALPSANGGIAILSLADGGSIAGVREVTLPRKLGQVSRCIWSVSGNTMAVVGLAGKVTTKTSGMCYAVIDASTGKVLLRSPSDLGAFSPGPPLPDGQKGVFSAVDMDFRWGTCTLGAKGLTRLCSGSALDNVHFAMPTWSSDSAHVYYLTSKGLRRAGADGSGNRLLTPFDDFVEKLGGEIDPTWYLCGLRPWPAGGELGFWLLNSAMADDIGAMREAVGKVDLATGVTTQICAGTGWTGIAVSPDEKVAAVLKNATKLGADLWLVDLATTRETRIAKGGVQGVAWVLGGSRVLFVKNKRELWLADPNTHELTKVWPAR
jgi:hypothetical protein